MNPKDIRLVVPADAPELLVCALLEALPDGKLQFADDEKTMCGGCHRIIVFRPYSKHIKLKLCADCAHQKMIKEGLVPEFLVDPKAVSELGLLWSKTKDVQ